MPIPVRLLSLLLLLKATHHQTISPFVLNAALDRATFVPLENSALVQDACRISYTSQLSSSASEDEYRSFLTTNNKIYNCADFSRRYFMYTNRKAEIERFNSAGYSYTREVNFFADLSDEEALRYLGVPGPDPDDPRGAAVSLDELAAAQEVEVATRQ